MAKKARNPHRRDQEWTRLLFYAKAMNVEVAIDDSPSPSGYASWTLDGKTITVYRKAHRTKIGMILSLIHELGHHLWFVHEKNRQPDLKFDEAIGHENRRGEKAKPIAKKLRKKIYDIELNSSLWWDIIYKDTHMQFAKWKLEAQRELDVWHYLVYYQTGYFPKAKRVKEKWAKIKAKYKKV